MAKPVQARRVVPEVRGAFLRAIKQMAAEGKPLSDVIYRELQDNPLRALDTLSKFIPKELLLDVDQDSPLAEIMRDISGKSHGLPEPIEGELVTDERSGVH